MAYTTPQNVWRTLGKNAWTKVRAEVVGTGNGTNASWSLDNDNLITSSLTIYTNSAVLPTTSYSSNLDDGTFSYTASNGVTLSADYDYADLPNSQIVSFISSSDAMIDSETGRTFGITTGSVEYYDFEESQDTIYVSNYPIVTLSTVESNVAGALVDPENWKTLTSGIGNDYICNSQDKSLGRIKFIDNLPYPGTDRVKITYDYGYSSTPSLVEELSTLLTIQKMVQSSVYKAVFKGQDNFTPVRLAEIDARIAELKRILSKKSFDLV